MGGGRAWAKASMPKATLTVRIRRISSGGDAGTDADGEPEGRAHRRRYSVFGERCLQGWRARPVPRHCLAGQQGRVWASGCVGLLFMQVTLVAFNVPYLP